VSDLRARSPLCRIALRAALYYILPMRPITALTRAVKVRPPEWLADATEGGAVSKSEVDRLPPHLERIADLIASVDDDVPEDLSARYKHYLRLWGYGRDRSAQMRQRR
jgi:hypothetical protein